MKKTFHSINAIYVTVSPSLLAALQADPNVKYVSPNRPHRSFLDLTTAAVSASVAWQSGFDGTGVGIAIALKRRIALKHDLTSRRRPVFACDLQREFRLPARQTLRRLRPWDSRGGHRRLQWQGLQRVGFTRTFKGVAPNTST